MAGDGVSPADVTFPSDTSKTAQAASSPNEGPLAEMVVTATRREENLSKVPSSITAFSQNSLDEHGIKDFQDLARFTPGVSISPFEGNNISIRGIGSSGGAATTGIYIDDTPIQNRSLVLPSEALPKTFDLDRVEILRGPQGTLFGAGSEGGTVRYIMTQPSLTSTSQYARGEVSYTQGGSPSYEAGAAAGIPTIDGSLGIRASVWYRRDGGWIDRVNPLTFANSKKNANYGEATALRLTAVWSPLTGLSVAPSVMYQDRKLADQSSYWGILSNPKNDNFVDGNPESNPADDNFVLSTLKIVADIGTAQLVENSSFYKRNDHELRNGTYYSLGLYQTLGWLPNPATGAVGSRIYLPFAGHDCPTMTACYPLIDSSGIHLPANLQNYRSPAPVNATQQVATQEFRLQSSDSGSFLQWTAGMFYSYNYSTQSDAILNPNVDELFEGLFGTTLGAANGQALNSNGSTFLPGGASYLNSEATHERQMAAFSEAVWSLTERFKLTTGLRYSKASFRFVSYTNGPANFGASSAAGDESDQPITERVAIAFHADPSNLYYGTYSTGFRPGGANEVIPPTACSIDFSHFGIDSAPRSYKSDTVRSSEVGAKIIIAERVKIATSIYYIHWDGIQQNIVLPNCGFNYHANLGRAVSKGFDLDGDLAVTDRFFLQSAIGYTVARYTNNVAAGPLATAPIIASGDAVASGVDYGTNTPVPPWTVAIGAKYTFQFEGYPWVARLDYELASRSPYKTANEDPRTVQFDSFLHTPSSSKTVSIRLGAYIKNFIVSGYIDNLFDSHTILTTLHTAADGAGPQPPTAPLFYQIGYRPRTYGITLIHRR